MNRQSRSSAVLMLIAATLTACGGGGGNASDPPRDTAAPETTLTTTTAARTNLSSASFSFTSELGATFEARTDNGAFAAVTSPHSVSALADGSHTYEIRARDTAGNFDPTPASFTWVVDTTPPDTQITSAPSNSAIVNTATFALGASEAGSTFEASVDGAAFAVVTSPHTVSGVADGNHSIRIRARDDVGNVDATPATANWTLDASAPEVRLTFPTRLFYTDASTISVRGTAQDARGVTALSVNGVAVQTSDGFAHWRAVIPAPFGSTPIRVTSGDGLGNTRAIDAATMVNRGTFVNDPRGIGYDGQRDRLILVDQAAGAVVAISRSDGMTRMLSPGPGPVPAPGTSPGYGLQGLVIDTAHDRALIIDSVNDELISVDLASGARSVVSASNGSSASTSIVSTFYLALDAAGQRVYIGAGLTASIVRIDLATGIRTVVSSPAIGTGDSIINPYGIVHDAVTNPAAPRLLVITSPFPPQGIVAVDLATGNRAPFSMGATGSGYPLTSPQAMVLDAAGQRLIVGNGPFDLVSVSLANGERTLISTIGPNIDSSPSFGNYLAFDPVARRVFATNWLCDFIEVDVVTRARTVIAGSGVGPPGLRSTQLGITFESIAGARSLVSVEGGFGILSRFNLSTAERAYVSQADAFGPGVGSGPSIRHATDMTLDRRPATNGRSALVLVQRPLVTPENPRLVSVDLATGNRTHVADIVVGNYSEPQKMALDVANNRIVFTNHEISPAFTDGLFAMDLSTGGITTLSDGAHSGLTLAGGSYVVLEPAVNPARALVADSSQPRILAIDLATGTRTVFDTLIAGRAGPMLIDTAHSRLLMINTDAPSSLVTTPLRIDGSARLLISGANPVSGLVRGGGPPMLRVSSFDVDSEEDVAYVYSGGSRSLLAIDMESGDRVVIER